MKYYLALRPNVRQVTTIFTRRGWLEAAAGDPAGAVAAGLRGRGLPPLLLEPGGGRGLRRPQRQEGAPGSRPVHCANQQHDLMLQMSTAFELVLNGVTRSCLGCYSGYGCPGT